MESGITLFAIVNSSKETKLFLINLYKPAPLYHFDEAYDNNPRFWLLLAL